MRFLCFPIMPLKKILSLPFYLPNQWGSLKTLCPDRLVYTALLSDRRHQYELISSPCSDLPLPTTECLSVGSSLSWDGPVYSAATLPAMVWPQFRLDLKERETTNEIKCEVAQTAAADLLPNESHITANISLLARYFYFYSSMAFGYFTKDWWKDRNND